MKAMRWMRTATAAAVTLGALGLAHSAQAQVTFTLGNNPQPGEENVLQNKGVTGTTITGTLDQSGLGVVFTSSQSLEALANGQARIDGTGGVNLSSPLTISLANGATFTDLIANPFSGTGTLTVRAVTSAGTFDNADPLGNGQNFFTLIANPGVTISSVILTGTNFSYRDLRQIRISGAALPAVVPEPGAYAAFLAGGLGALGLMARARRGVVRTAAA